MSEGPTKRARPFQFSLAAMLVLTTAVAVSVALAMTDWQFAVMWSMYVVAPFVIGFGVGRFSRSRAQLLTAPPIAAAVAPLPWAILAGINKSPGEPLADFLRWWVMLFPLFLLLGAIPALAGSALGYWFKTRATDRAS